MRYILYHPKTLPLFKDVDFLENHPGIEIIDDAGKAFLVEETATHAMDEIRADLGSDWIIEPENLNYGLL